MSNLDELLGTKEIVPGTGFLKMVIAGPPKVGKSFLAGTAQHDPRLAPVLFITQEYGGDQGLETLPEPRPKVIYCETLKHTFEAFWKIIQAIKEETCPYKTIVFDTYSEAHAQMIRESARKRAGINDKWSTQDYTVSQLEYTTANKEMRELVERLKKLPVNVIVTCHTKEDTKLDKNGNVSSSRTVFAVSEGSREPLERGFSLIGYYDFARLWETDEKGEVLTDKEGNKLWKEKRVLMTTPKRDRIGGAWGNYTRIGDMVEPTMTKIMDAIEGKEAE